MAVTIIKKKSAEKVEKRTSAEVKAEFLKRITRVAAHKNVYEIFNDFIYFTATSMRNAYDRQDQAKWQEREENYLRRAKSYSKEEMTEFSRLYALLVEGIEEGDCDFLGEVYMELSIGNKNMGQFFTPFSVSQLMAKLMGNTYTHRPETINDPTCGAGGLLIGHIKQCKNSNVNYQLCKLYTGTDLDLIGVQMTYIQLSLLGAMAEITHGNSLTLKTYDVYITPMCHIHKAEYAFIKAMQLIAKREVKNG